MRHVSSGTGQGKNSFAMQWDRKEDIQYMYHALGHDTQMYTTCAMTCHALIHGMQIFDGVSCIGTGRQIYMCHALIPGMQIYMCDDVPRIRTGRQVPVPVYKCHTLGHDMCTNHAVRQVGKYTVVMQWNKTGKQEPCLQKSDSGTGRQNTYVMQ
jgi:hypothetical protein